MRDLAQIGHVPAQEALRGLETRAVPRKAPVNEHNLRPAPTSPNTARALYSDGLNAYAASDYARARGLFDQACAAGSATSCVDLGLMFSIGRGGPRDVARARKLYDQACQAGEASGCARLRALDAQQR